METEPDIAISRCINKFQSLLKVPVHTMKHSITGKCHNNELHPHSTWNFCNDNAYEYNEIYLSHGKNVNLH